MQHFAEYWFRKRYIMGELGRKRARGRTCDGVEEHLRNHLLPALGRLRMDEVTSAHVHDLFGRLPTGPATKNRIRTTLKALFADARRAGMGGWLFSGRDPTVELAPFAEPVVARPALRPEEFEAVIAAAAGMRSHGLIAAMLEAGERLEELLRLRHRQVVVGPHFAPAAGVFRWGARDCKEGKPKEVPFSHRVLALLPLRADAHPESRVWPDLYDKRVRAELRRACELAGLERDVTPHGLRHSVAQKLWLAGVSIEAIRPLFGHSSNKITERYVAGAKDLVQKIKLIHLDDLDGEALS